jgi:hypothetical protein
MKHKLLIIVLATGLLIIGASCSLTTSISEDDSGVTDPTRCLASSEWVNNPDGAPSEIPLGDKAQICQFHQFSWKWFIALMNESNNGMRTFQDQETYPLFLGDQNSCTATGVDTQLFVRIGKDNDGPDDDFILPEDIQQAGSESIIYDQNGNVVYYEVRFSRDQCTLDPHTVTMFPAGTTEIKISWRVIEEADKANYVWMMADLDKNGKVEASELLGMVGFHFVKSTPLHPEFIWATFEHKQNAPDCQAFPTDNQGWSFASATCASQLPASVDPIMCAFNKSATPEPTATPVLSGGPATEICRVYHDGSQLGDNQYDVNVAAIDALNEQLTGPTGFITALPDSNPLAVLQNYELVGSLWVSDIAMPSTLENQRGSIQLANTTMETTEQQGFSKLPYTGPNNLTPAANCFACHNYDPNIKGETNVNVCVSHIFSLISGTSNPPSICK